LVPRPRVLALDVGVLLQRADRVCSVTLGLVCGREIAVPLRAVRMLCDLLLRLRDRRPAVVEDVQAAEELVETARPGADAEERERDGEEDCEDDVGELRLPPQPHEEELLIGVAAAGMAASRALAPRCGLRLCTSLCLFRLDCCARHRPLRVAPLAGWAGVARRGWRARSRPRRAPRAG